MVNNNNYKLLFFLTFLVVVVTFWFVYMTYQTSTVGFHSGDPKMKELENAIKVFEQANGYPPNDIYDLVPEYLPRIELPYSVDSIDYIESNEQDTWELIFVIDCFGSYKLVGDSDERYMTLLSPEQVIECQR